MKNFLTDLAHSGRVRVRRHPDLAPAMDQGIEETLARMDDAARQEMPGEAPPLDPSVASWAAGLLYQACQFLVFRDMPAERIGRALATPCPAVASPGAHYSADLTLRYLPDVLHLACGLASGDPLVVALRELACRWPLSSVGVSGVRPGDIGPIVGHPGLLALYVDRILERNDLERLAASPVREAARAALGAHGRLAPRVARFLAEPEGAR